MIFTAVSQMIVNTSVVIMIFALCFVFSIFIPNGINEYKSYYHQHTIPFGVM